MSKEAQLAATKSALGIGGNIIAQGINFGMQNHFSQQQMENQKALTRFNRLEQMQMWRDTNYSAQMNEMKKAGLNPNLMYGMGGGGGVTAQVNAGQTGRGTSTPMDMSAVNNALEMAADIELKRAAAEKTKAETAEVEARTPTHAKSIEKTDAEIQEIASRLNVNEETVKKILQDVKQSEAETDKTQMETWKLQELTPVEKRNLEQEFKRRVTENVYLDAKERTELSNLVIDVIKKREEIAAIQAGVTQKDEDIDLKKFEADLKAKYPSLYEVAGGVINQILTFFTKGKDTNYKHPNDRRR